MMKLFKGILKRKWLLLLIIIIVGFVGFKIFGKKSTTAYETVTASRGQVVERVTATGQIKPKDSASMRFRTAGIISSLLVDVGDTITAGQLLARLDDSDLRKKLTQAQADYNAADVSARNAAQNVEDTKTKNAQNLKLLYADATNAFNDIANATLKAYTGLTGFFDGSNNLISAINNVVSNTQLTINAQGNKAAADLAMKALSSQIINVPMTIDSNSVDAILNAIGAPLQTIQTALNSVIEAINSVPTGALSSTAIDSYKTTLSSSKDYINAAISKQTTLRRDIDNTNVTNSLNLNAAEADLRLANAKRESARAAVDISQRNLSDTLLYAPISGTIAVKSKETGELVTTADQVYYIIGKGDLEVVSNIPEVDVSRIALSNEVDTTLDALGSGEHFAATITSVDPDQTTIDGVVYYKTHFVFAKTDPRFKPGMSVNLTIAVNKRDNVIVIPRRAVTQKGAVTSVRILQSDGKAISRDVVLGLRGDTTVEVLSGLAEGEKVVIAEKTQ